MIILKFIPKILSIAMAISYCYIGYYNIVGPFSLGFIVLFFLTLIFLFLQISKDRMPLHNILILLSLICIIFIWLDLVLNMEFRMNALQQYITPIAIFFSTTGIIYYLNFTKFYLLTFIMLILISSFIALFQGFDFDFAWDLRYALPESTDTAVENQLKLKAKPAGLSFYAVQLGYQIVFAGCLLLILNSIYRSVFTNKLFNASYILLLLASAIGENLSSFLALIIMAFVFYTSRTEFTFRYNHFLITILLIIILFFLPIWDRIINPDASLISRITFLIVGIQLLIYNPFGISRNELYQAKLEIVNELYGAGSFSLLENILETSFHNSFINIGIQIGWIGFILYVYLYLYMMQYYKSLISNKVNEISLIGSTGLAFLFGYGVQCITHNAGPMTKDPFFWIANGFLIGIFLTTKKNLHHIKQYTKG